MLVAVSSRYDIALERLLAAAATMGARLLVAGEFMLDGKDGYESDAPEFDRIGGLVATAGIPLLLGYRESCATGIYSAAQLLDGLGHSISNCRSAHPARSRKDVAGNAGVDDGNWLTVSRWSGSPFSALLGDDILHPEIARAVMLQGAEVILALRRDPLADEELERAILRTRAFENATHVIGLFGHRLSAFAGDGSPLSPCAAEDGVLIVDLPVISLAKPARRPELYGQLVVADTVET